MREGGIEEEKSSSLPCKQVRKSHCSRKEKRRWQHVSGETDKGLVGQVAAEHGVMLWSDGRHEGACVFTYRYMYIYII